MRAVAAACGAAACAGAGFPPPPRTPAPAPRPPPPAGEPEVLIVGAGWAGMGAAVTLAKANVSFRVLEAKNHTGGRTHSFMLGGYQYESCSNWICGQRSEVAALAETVGLRMRVDKNYAPHPPAKVYDEHGGDGDADGAVQRAAQAALTCIRAAAGRKNAWKTSVRDALTKCGWVPKTGVEKAYDWYITVDEAGMPADQQELDINFGVAARGRRAARLAASAPGDWTFVTDQKPRGYARCLDQMGTDAGVPPGDERVSLNKEVTKIAYGTSGVKVSTKDGDSYDAAATIVTLPLGVLNRRHKELFDPVLPSKWQDIFDGGKLVMTNETKIHIQFPTCFWDNSVIQFIAAPADGEPAGDFCEFLNMNHEDNMPGSNTLLIFLGDPESSKYEVMDDASVQQAVLKKLAQIYPKATIPAPTAFHMTRHSQDPFMSGAYSGFHPGFDSDDYGTLMSPILDQRLYLAGEAVCYDLSGYTHGGLQAGVQTAQAYLHKTGRGGKPKDSCGYA